MILNLDKTLRNKKDLLKNFNRVQLVKLKPYIKILI